MECVMILWSGHTISALEKKAYVVKNPPIFVVIMKACMSVLIASSEPFPGHADNSSYCTNHISAMVEYLLNWDSSYKEKEN